MIFQRAQRPTRGSFTSPDTPGLWHQTSPNCVLLEYLYLQGDTLSSNTESQLRSMEQALKPSHFANPYEGWENITLKYALLA